MNPSLTDAIVPAIEMSGVSVGAREEPETPVLEKIDWTVMPGEYWVIGGMHGAGKTALLSLAVGLTAPLQGRYRLYGQDMPAKGDQFLAERLRIGLVFDNGQLFHQLTIQENIALPLFYHRNLPDAELIKTVNAIIEWADLTPYASSLPGGVGREWLKRAGLARSLVLQPEALLLDNVLSGLDSRHVHWWLEALDELSAGGGPQDGRRLTVIAATQDLRPWRHRAAQFAVLQRGRLCVLGHHPHLSDLRDPLVKELLAEPLPAA
jgi:ABC-type transporter Mla maintaining outer membrane lipid asymmetry ATPase subunit MlaF